MPDVLFVSKPVAPPWNDSSKNLVRDVAGSLERHTPIVMGRAGQANPLGTGRLVPVYAGGSSASFSPRLRDNVDVLRHLAWGPSVDVWHFFFAPNIRSSLAGRLASAVRRVSTVHTVCSMPPEEAPLRKLVFADVTVTLSQLAYDRFLAEGVRKDALSLIPPSVPALAEPTAARRSELRAKHGLPESTAVWIYPGDLEHGGGAAIAVRGLAASSQRDGVLLMACREKTPRAAEARSELVRLAESWGIDARVRWVGETPHIHELLALSDYVVLPNSSSFAKMDYPIVALEAMCMGRPVLVGSGTPSAELARDGGALAIETHGEALAEAIEGLNTNAPARQALGRRARQLALTRFSPRTVAAAYERIYDELHG